MGHTLHIQRTKWNTFRIPLISLGILKSPHCFILLIHSDRLERQRTQTVDSLESPDQEVKVCKASFQKWGARQYQNLTLIN